MSSDKDCTLYTGLPFTSECDCWPRCSRCCECPECVSIRLEEVAAGLHDDFWIPAEWTSAETPYECAWKLLLPRLGRLADRLRKTVPDSCRCGPLTQAVSEDYGLAFEVLDTDGGAFEVSIVLVDACEHEGEDGEGRGSIHAESMTSDGRELARLAPYNFTRRCWVDLADGEQLADRLRLIESHADEFIGETLAALAGEEGAPHVQR